MISSKSELSKAVKHKQSSDSEVQAKFFDYMQDVAVVPPQTIVGNTPRPFLEHSRALEAKSSP